jgi:hypothetical protein
MSGNHLTWSEKGGTRVYDMSGIIALADELKNNRMLKTFDISNNEIGGRQGAWNTSTNAYDIIATPEGPEAIAQALKGNVRK